MINIAKPIINMAEYMARSFPIMILIEIVPGPTMKGMATSDAISSKFPLKETNDFLP